jgi:hypothetical protein
MTEHPITPPPELVQQWWTEFERTEPDTDSLVFIATQAARWGADQELEACVEWLIMSPVRTEEYLRAARRPKPLSLKEQALQALDKTWAAGYIKTESADTIRHALEQLP